MNECQKVDYFEYHEDNKQLNWHVDKDTLLSYEYS